MCVHPYGYIIFGIGSHIPILNFDFFCWSEFFSKFVGGTDYFVVCVIFEGGDLINIGGIFAFVDDGTDK